MGVIRNVITTDCVLCRQQLFNDQIQHSDEGSISR